MRVRRTKKTARAKSAARSTRSKKTAAAPASTQFAWATSSRAIVAGLIFVVVAAALLTAREDTPRAEVARDEMAPAGIAVENDTPRPLEATKAVTGRASTTAVEEPSGVSTYQTVELPAESEAPVTIAGCLESDEGTFRLTDASGDSAPRSRSWKSGFLKKRPAQIELADAVGTLNLRHHVGHRIAATGTLIDREMRVRSVRLAGTCD